jgi:hypothetical protein
MNVEKRDAITFTKRFAVDVNQLAANLLQPPDRNVAWNKRVGDTCEASGLQVHVGAADFRQLDFE